MLPKTSKKVETQETASAAEVYGVYNATNPVWTKFNGELDTQLLAMEERFRPYWTMRAVRASVGR